MKAIVIVLLTCMFVSAQSSSDLRQKYGIPISETYKVRPDVVVTVTYAKTGEVCSMVIKPQPSSTKKETSTPVLKSKLLDEVIDELVLKEKRGKYLMGTFLNIICLPDNDCAGTSENYEKLSIYRNGSIDAHRYATIDWKSSACKQRRNPTNQWT